MNSQKILYGAGLVCLATILPALLPAQAEKVSQNSVDITRQESSQDSQRKESKNVIKGDRQSDHNYNKDSRDHHDRDRNDDGGRKHHDDHDSDRDHDGGRKHHDSDRDHGKDAPKKNITKP